MRKQVIEFGAEQSGLPAERVGFLCANNRVIRRAIITDWLKEKYDLSIEQWFSMTTIGLFKTYRREKQAAVEQAIGLEEQPQ